MDVTLNTNFFPIAKANLNSTTISSGTEDIAHNNNTEKKFDYTSVLMDIEDLQNFLFMLIGSEIPGKSAGDDIGNKLNLLA
jgi:hypothetical protein